MTASPGDGARKATEVGLFCLACHSTMTASDAMADWTCCAYGCARPLQVVVRPVTLREMLRSEEEGRA
jgi:hypothetical protein